jgi:acyl dehydratase
MKTIEVHQAPGMAEMLRGVLDGRGKRPGLISELPGVTLVSPNVRLDAAHIARYSALCGFTPAQGVPLIYPQMLTFAPVMTYLNSADCPWPALGTVHLANQIEQHRSLHAGDTVRVEMSTGVLLAHEKGQVFTLDLRILRADELVWSATQSLLRLGVKQPGGDAYVGQLGEFGPLSCQAQFSAKADIGRRYGAVSGDRNPIHLSALSARMFGFRRAIAHGMWTKARALSCVLPQRALEQAKVAVEFKTPLFLPAQPTLWTSRANASAQFEVRDSQGVKPHLRGQLDY